MIPGVVQAPLCTVDQTTSDNTLSVSSLSVTRFCSRGCYGQSTKSLQGRRGEQAAV